MTTHPQDLRLHVFLSVHPRFLMRISLAAARRLGHLTPALSVQASHPLFVERCQKEFGELPIVLRDWQVADVAWQHGRATDEDLVALEALVDPLSVWELLAIDRRHNAGWTREQLLGFAVLEARAIQSHLDNFQPTHVIMDDVSCIPSLLLWCIARQRGIPVISVGSARTRKRIWFRTALYESNYEYEQRLSDLREAGFQGDADVARYLEELSEGKAQLISKSHAGTAPPSVTLKDLRPLFNVSLGHRRVPHNRVMYGGMVASLTRRTRRIMRSRLQAHLFANDLPLQRFVLFTLHFQPEGSTDYLAPAWVDQVTVVRQIALSLPAGWLVVVKEHAPSLGRRNTGFYKELRDMPNVHLLQAQSSSLDAAKAAQGIATITGSIGWEGWCMRKPVAVLGQTRFDSLPGVTKILGPQDWRRWTKLVAEGVAPRPTPTDVAIAVRALLDVTAEAHFGDDSTPSVAERTANAEVIAEALVERLNWMQENACRESRYPLADGL